MIKTDTWTGGTDEEYETQHFGFGAQRLKIAVRQMVEQKIRTGVKDMETYLQESLNLNDTDQATLTHSCEKLIRLYCDRAGPSLLIIDGEIERILKVPQNVLLPDDEVQKKSATQAEYEIMKEEVANLRRRVERGALMEALLSAEEEELSLVDNVCETAKKDMEVIDFVYKTFEDSEGVKVVDVESGALCASVPFIKNDEDSIFDD